MFVWDRTTLSGGEAGKMHEAGHVDANEHVRIGIKNVVELKGAHLAGDVREGDREGAAKSATLLLLAEGNDFGVFDRSEESADRLAGGGATAVARAVEGDASRILKLAGPSLDAEAVVNEIDDLPRAVRERGDGGIRIFLKLKEIPVAVHRRTGTGGNDHGKLTREDIGSVFCDFA